MPSPDSVALIRTALADVRNQWSVGSYGAIAEFMRDAGEAAEIRETDAAISVVTAKGAIRVARDAGLRPVAYEALSAHRDRWLQGVAFCRPLAELSLGGRRTLTELGPDWQAIRDRDLDAVLFDLGVGAPHIEALIRVADSALTQRLRAHLGQALLPGPHPAMAAIVAAGPHRVFRSDAARVEVYQPIPGPGATAPPPGPHTHVLPKLLRAGRSHAATTPLPRGQVPLLGLHPESPVTDALGRPRAYDGDAHRRFLNLLDRWGRPDFLRAKAEVRQAVRAGKLPEFAQPMTRLRRTAIRIQLRQLDRMGAPAATLAAWRAAYDPVEAGPVPANAH